MFCNVCDKDVRVCKCPDIDARMKAMADSSSNSLLWCINCDKHHKRCDCFDPHFMLSNEWLKEKPKKEKPLAVRIIRKIIRLIFT